MSTYTMRRSMFAGPYQKEANDDQVDDSIADAGSWHGNRNDGNRSAGLVGWL
jgi:hypothetical protein